MRALQAADGAQTSGSPGSALAVAGLPPGGRTLTHLCHRRAELYTLLTNLWQTRLVGRVLDAGRRSGTQIPLLAEGWRDGPHATVRRREKLFPPVRMGRTDNKPGTGCKPVCCRRRPDTRTLFPPVPGRYPTGRPASLVEAGSGGFPFRTDQAG